MSIDVGFTNDRYVPAFAEKKGETLNINSFVIPNVINLNTEPDSFSNAFISYKNFKTGIDDNGYSILKDDICITTFNSNVITTFTDVDFQENFVVRDAFYINSNINTNIVFKLQDGDSFHINNKDNMELFVADSSKINIKQDIEIESGKTLFVNKIESIDGTTIQLNNVQYTDATLDSLKANNTLSVEDTTIDYSGDTDILRGCVDVIKTNNTRDYLKLRSTKASDTNTDTVLNVNRFGNINIGHNEGDEESTINISKISKNILNYKGTNDGDVFQMTQHADIGIGTIDPSAQLHIKRNDGENITNPTFYRKNTMLHIDMDYDVANNTRSFFEEISAHFNQENKPVFWFLESIDTVYLTNPITSDYFNTIELNGESVTQQTIEDTYTNTQNFTEIIPGEVSDTLPDNFDDDDRGVITPIITKLKGSLSIVYPNFENSINLTKSVTTESIVFVATGDNNRTKEIKIPYTLYIQNGETVNQDYVDYQSIDILLYKRERAIGATDGIVYYNFYLSLTIWSNVGESPKMDYTYREYNTELIPPPDFLTINKNQNFVSSISANGTLSLGSDAPEEKNDYLLYATGKCYVKTLNTSNFITDDPQDIMYFNNANFSNVNSIQTEKMNITNMKITNLTSDVANFDTITTRSLTFDEINSTNFIYSDSETKLHNKLILEKEDTSLLLNVSSASGGIVNGLVVTNNTSSCNPCIDINGTNNQSPHLSLSLGSGRTYMRYMEGTDDNKFFQLYSDGKITIDKQHSIINYNTHNNVLAVGGNAICVNYKNFDDYKITIGINSSRSVSDSFSIDSENDYILHDELKKINATEPDICLYGNVHISSKDGDKLIQTTSSGSLILTNNIIIETAGTQMSLTEYIQSIIVEQIEIALGEGGSIKGAINDAMSTASS
jgi:hypothetical protein